MIRSCLILNRRAVVTAFQLSGKPATTRLTGASRSIRSRAIFTQHSPDVWRLSKRNLALQSIPDLETESNDNFSFFAKDTPDFASMGLKSQILIHRVENVVGLQRPTTVQAAAFDAIQSQQDVMVGAETGSGKTLAYLLPIMDDILQQKQSEAGVSYDFCRAIILVPNKELVQQVVRMAMSLSGGRDTLLFGGSTLTDTSQLPPTEPDLDPRDTVRLAILPGGLKEPIDFPPFRGSVTNRKDEEPVDLVVSTPASLAPLGLKPSNIDMFADVKTLVIDEADMLLDGGYIRALENVLMGFRRADKLDPSLGVEPTQHVFVAATLPDFGTRSVDAYLQKKFPRASRMTMAGMHNARHFGLEQQTNWIEMEGKKERMEKLVELLQSSREDGGLMGEKVMVFLNSVDDVEGACQALLRAGINALPYHAKVSLSDRTKTLDRFRRYNGLEDSQEDTVPVLVCSDLAARGIDVPGVHAVVQLQFAGNVVAHLHRMGRCGRAGQRTGRGIVFYGRQEGELVDVVREAETMQEKMVLPGDVIDLTDEDLEGTVKQAFSRKRGFTKKRKKLKKEANA